MRKVIRNKLHFLMLAAAIMLTLGGCAVGPDYIRPEAPEPDKWMEEGPKLKGEPTDVSAWWHVFNDPVLDALVEKAYQQNLDLRVAGIRVLEARAQLGIAVGSLYPQTQRIKGSSAGVRISENTANIPAIWDPTYGEHSLAFDAAWELDFWGKFRRGVESGIANWEASVAGYDNFLVTLVAEVARTYVVIRTLEDRLDIARRNVRIQQRSLDIADARFQGGDVTELDVTQARALLRNTQAQIPRLQAGLRQAKNGLSILLGELPGQIDTLLVGSHDIPSAPTEVAVGVPAELLRRRPDIRLAERRLAAQSAQIGVAKADLYPHFGLFGSIGFSARKPSDLFKSSSLAAIGGPGVSWDIFQYGRIRNRTRVEDARFQQLAVNYENTVLKAAQEAEDAMAAFMRSQEEVFFLGEAVSAAQRSVDLSMLQYREGSGSWIHRGSWHSWKTC